MRIVKGSIKQDLVPRVANDQASTEQTHSITRSLSG